MGKVKSRYVLLRNFTYVFYVLVILYLIVIFALNIELKNKATIATLLFSSSAIGLFYNLFVVKIANKSNRFYIYYGMAVFPLFQLLVMTDYAGGTSSLWYGVFLMFIIAISILGFRAFYFNLGIVSVYFVFDILMSLTSEVQEQFNFVPFPYTLVALAVSAFIAYWSDQRVHHGKTDGPTHEKVSENLKQASLSEKVLLSAIADPLVAVDTNLKVILINEAAQSLSGWKMRDALGINVTQVFKLIDNKDNKLEIQSNPFMAAIEKESIINLNNAYIMSKDNQKISISLSVAPMIEQDVIVGAIAVMRDTTQQKLLQREKNEFISTASHEMRTPVAAIEGFISMATNPNLATIDARARGYLEKAHSSSLHLGKLFKDLLSITNLEDRDIKDNKRVFNVSDLVLATCSEMEPIAQKKGLKIYSHIGGAKIKNELVVAPTMNVYADPDRLREVIVNLIDNAIKYTASGRVSAEIISDKNNVTVSISDQGMGINKKDQAHIFEKFYRADNALTREQSGTGLGLYISRKLIELYGGKIWVESSLGKGSIFSFSLPLVK